MSFSFISDELRSRRLGFIAQDVQDVYPLLVGADKDGFLSVDYTRVLPYATAAIQELSSVKVTRLEEEIEENEAAILELEKENSLLEAKLNRMVRFQIQC